MNYEATADTAGTIGIVRDTPRGGLQINSSESESRSQLRHLRVPYGAGNQQSRTGNSQSLKLTSLVKHSIV